MAIEALFTRLLDEKAGSVPSVPSCSGTDGTAQKPLEGAQLLAFAGSVPSVPSVPSEKTKSETQPDEINRDVLTPEAESAIREWLAHIDETDPDIIAETVQRCRDNPETRAYFLGRANEVKKTVRDATDDRRYCRECRNLSEAGFCRQSLTVTGAKDYQPNDTVPRRCPEFHDRTAKS